ncbi:hypothetical protein XU18_4976 [Perkinsela sp. CCAP 1560/4]|nr:hypothetical protein XU18_4976 [Perkinsela sp. CCAP 1560/4]|eukprot:KNH00519.1 hypothetical protein XU18_4976 [Perkinsela sp. CCAP 1560/4]
MLYLIFAHCDKGVRYRRCGLGVSRNCNTPRNRSAFYRWKKSSVNIRQRTITPFP